jgi:hypothetical protein
MDMDINEHERLSNVTLKTQIKVKKKTNIFTAVLHFKVTDDVIIFNTSPLQLFHIHAQM